MSKKTKAEGNPTALWYWEEDFQGFWLTNRGAILRLRERIDLLKKKVKDEESLAS